MGSLKAVRDLMNQKSMQYKNLILSIIAVFGLCGMNECANPKIAENGSGDLEFISCARLNRAHDTHIFSGHRAFVASSVYNGSPSDLDSANQFCTQTAQGAGFDGQWKAIPVSNGLELTPQVIDQLKLNAGISSKITNPLDRSIAQDSAKFWQEWSDNRQELILSKIGYEECGNPLNSIQSEGDWSNLLSQPASCVSGADPSNDPANENCAVSTYLICVSPLQQ